MLPDKSFTKPVNDKRLLVGEVYFEDLVDRLSFTQEGVHRAVMEQAKLYLAASEYRIKKMKLRQEAEAQLQDVRTSLSLRMHQEKERASQKSLTERGIIDTIEQNKTVRELRQKVDQATRLEEWSKLLLEAYRQRKDALKILAWFAYAEDSMKVGEAGLKVMKDKRDKLKRELRSEREPDPEFD